MKTKLFILSLFIICIACEKEKTSTALPFYAASGSVYISNEGNFQSGNSSVCNYNPATGVFTDNIFTNANNQPLGDICQSMAIMFDKMHLVVNNSGKIEVCDPHTLKKSATITGLTSPRYTNIAANGKIYVTDGYSNNISIIDHNSNSVVGTIPMTGFAEQMISYGSWIIVTNTSSEYLYVIDPIIDAMIDSIHISKGANSICYDMNAKLWVLCGGDYLGTYNGALYCINALTKQIEVTIPFQPNEFPNKLCINASRDSLYFLNTNVWKMSITGNSMPANPFVTSSGNNFYGLGIDKTRNEVYVSDAVDYIQNGKIYRYAANGTLINMFNAGIIPGDFLFVP